jgi:arsenite methyltransferase
LPLLHRWKAAQFPDCEARIATDPMTNYTERDFVRYVQQTGFTSIHMEFHMDICVRETSWEVFLGSSPHPLAPSLDTILAERFNAQERLCFEQTLRPALEAGQLSTTSRMAYMTATKPG